MSDFEKQEALWDTENGMANREEEHTEVQVEAVTEDVEDDFEIPDIPSVFSMPEPTVPTEEDRQQSQTQSAPQPHVWNSKTTRQQVKEAKKKYRLEKKRLRREKRMRGPGWWKILTTGLICALVGGLVGAVITITALSVSNQIFHIDLLDLKPEQIEIIREQYIAQIQEYKSPGTAVYQKNAGSVVYVKTSGGKADSVWEQQDAASNMVSGVVYQADGYVLVNVGAIRSVLQADGTLRENATIEVYLPQKKETAYPARVVGYDWETDVALLHIDATELYPVEFGDSAQVAHGESVFTMLYADGTDTPYIQGSLVSSIQSDFFSIDRGTEQAWKNSPLFSAEGKFIGMNSAKEEVSLAVPSNRIGQVCKQILEKEKK